MNQILEDLNAYRHRERAEINRNERSANSDVSRNGTQPNLPNAEQNYWRLAVGACIERARLLAGWTLKELSAEIGKAEGRDRDMRQVARWIAGAERPQFDVLFSVPRLRPYLVMAISELGREDGVEIIHTIEIRVPR